MLKFIKHHMTGIDGIEIYPIISLSIFVLFFAGMLVWAFREKKEKIEELRKMPLD